jgi:FKBP-type peptidyl-prolyl cis-trans isomerase SlyD
VSNSNDKPIADGDIVFLQYTLRNDAGEILDQASADDPLFYLHGAENIVPGLEKELTGKQPGDRFQVTIAPAEGYGERSGPGPQAVPRASFPDTMAIEAGMPFLAEGEDGRPFPVWVSSADAHTVMVDRNHPLAGETLHFDVEVVRTRPATRDELAHGHPHGPEGTEHHHH